MKRYNPMRADVRSIEEKALGLIMAMTNEQAKGLYSMLSAMAQRDSERAKILTGEVKTRQV